MRELASRVLQAVHGATWDLPVTPGRQVGSTSEDPFQPALETYLVWLVEWEHEFDLGDVFEPPEKGRSILWGVDPETGPHYMDRYRELSDRDER